MPFFPIRWICRRNFISNKRGFTLTEVMVAMLMSAAVGLGLMVALEVGLRSFKSAEARLRLQRDGAAAVEEFSRILQTAEAVSGEQSEFVFRIPSPRFEPEPDSMVALSIRGGKLFSGSRQVVPAPWEDGRVSVASAELFKTPDPGEYLLKILMTYAPPGNAPLEQRLFETRILSRNLLINPLSNEGS